MTKKKKDSSQNQTTLFDLLRESQSAPLISTAPGSLDIDTELRRAISEDLRFAVFQDGRPMSRHEVAARMSDLAGENITFDMLNNWTAEAKVKHRFPACFLPAFVSATGGQRRAHAVISRHSGLFALPGAEALRAEIQKMRESISKEQNEMKKRIMFLREIEKK